MRRVIAHLDIDAFYASVELMRRPELRGRPVIVSGRGPRAVVTTASYEARRYGVGSAMPTSRALRLCPQAVVIPPDFPAYREASRRVWEIVARHLGVIEQVGLDEGYLDLSELVAPKAAVRRVVAEIRDRTGLGVSVGIGPNRLVAKVASDCEKPAGLVVLSTALARERFASASPRLLPGIGPRTAERLSALGIDTLSALRGAEPGRLAQAFGANQAAFLQRRAHFEDDAPLTPVREAKSQSVETTFDVDVADRAAMQAALERLAHELGRRLGSRGRAGRNVAIKVRLDDWTTITRARTLPAPVASGEEIARVARELLTEYAPPRPVRLLGVRLAAFERPSAPRAPAVRGGDQMRFAV